MCRGVLIDLTRGEEVPHIAVDDEHFLCARYAALGTQCVEIVHSQLPLHDIALLGERVEARA